MSLRAPEGYSRDWPREWLNLWFGGYTAIVEQRPGNALWPAGYTVTRYRPAGTEPAQNSDKVSDNEV